jgi:hypothetical protein
VTGILSLIQGASRHRDANLRQLDQGWEPLLAPVVSTRAIEVSELMTAVHECRPSAA